MIKNGRYYRIYKSLFIMTLFSLMALNIFISYSKSKEYMVLASACLLWVFYELYGMIFSGKWTAGYAMVDENKGVGMQYVPIKWLFITIYLGFSFGASLGGLWL